MAKKKQRFLRIGYTQYSKLGLRRRKKQKYRKAKGIDNKVRLKMKGHLKNVNIGFRTEKKNRSLVKGLKPALIHDVKDLQNLKQGEIAIVARIGNKKRIEIAKYSLEKNIGLSNINPRKFLDKIEQKSKLKKEKDSRKIEKKKQKEEKEKEEKVSDKAEIKNEKKEQKESVKNYETDIKQDVEEINNELKK